MKMDIKCKIKSQDELNFIDKVKILTNGKCDIVIIRHPKSFSYQSKAWALGRYKTGSKNYVLTINLGRFGKGIIGTETQLNELFDNMVPTLNAYL